MGSYRKKCPYCGHILEQGYGLPNTRFGNPKRRCTWCNNTYIDRNIIDWESASIFKKISFCFANGRFFLCLIPYVIATARIGPKVCWEDWLVYLACLPIFLIAFALCVTYVLIRIKLHYGYIPSRRKRKSK